ncbi:MAG: endonuclease/exonuclease/phosphatase family protein [Bacteriovoracia bacterium]
MTWNIAYGYGIGSDGVQYCPKPRAEFERRLTDMAELIRREQADIVLLQEVDFHARRSHFIDEMEYLRERSGLAYAAACVSWNHPYVPFPYWPLSYHFGRVKSGGAVLSRFPVLENRPVLHEKPRKNPWWYNWFYLGRYSQWVKIQGPGGEFWVANNHFDAYDGENRESHARRLGQFAEEMRMNGARVLGFGGDLNTTPPEATVKHGFADYTRDDYRGDRAIETLRGLAGFREVVGIDEYVAQESRYFTFPSVAPTRRLDYLFVDAEARMEGHRIISTGDLSDHLPLIALVDS